MQNAKPISHPTICYSALAIIHGLVHPVQTRNQLHTSQVYQHPNNPNISVIPNIPHIPVMKTHHYKVNMTWTGNRGAGTASYTAYDRNHTIVAGQKPVIPGSSDPSFRGDAMRYNPEELLVASLSSCHMLWFLHLCSVAGVIVVEYVDDAAGDMEETADGGGHFTEVTLFPVITVASEEMIEKADELHEKANELCFIARSCNFPVHHKPIYKVSRLVSS